MSEQEAVGKEDAIESTLRENKFQLKMSGIHHLKFEVIDHFITSGQPWEGISKIVCDIDGSGCIMYVMAGRVGSKETASWFADAIRPGSAIGCETNDAMPEKLNFAFIGKMSFDHDGHTYTGDDIVIAQGHNGFRNNWWIGGPHMTVLVALPPFIAAAGQNFKVKAIPPIAKIAFMASGIDVSKVHMKLIELPK